MLTHNVGEKKNLKIRIKYKLSVYSDNMRDNTLGTSKSSYMLASIKTEIDKALKNKLPTILYPLATLVSKFNYTITVHVSCYMNLSSSLYKEIFYSIKFKTMIHGIVYEIEFPSTDSNIRAHLFKESSYFDYTNHILKCLHNKIVSMSVSDYAFIKNKPFKLMYDTKNMLDRIFNINKDNSFEKFIFSIDDFLKPIKENNNRNFYSIDFLLKDCTVFNRITIWPYGRLNTSGNYIDILEIKKTEEINYNEYGQYSSNLHLNKTDMIELLVKSQILDEFCLDIDIEENKLEELLEMTKVIQY